MSQPHPDLACRQLIELVTDYLDAELTPAEHMRVEQHLLVCRDCVRYVAQMRVAIASLATLQLAPSEPSAREALLAAFRARHAGGSQP